VRVYLDAEFDRNRVGEELSVAVVRADGSRKVEYRTDNRPGRTYKPDGFFIDLAEGDRVVVECARGERA